MKKSDLLKALSVSVLAATAFSQRSAAQTYCSAASTLGTPYFFAFSFNLGSNMSGGQSITNNGSSYTNNTGLGSAATLVRYFGSGSPFAIYNPSMTTTFASGNVAVFADWNADGDFDDLYENAFSAAANISPNTSYNSTAFIFPPVNIPAGNYRLRYTYAESATPSACGTAFTGETEDFTITLPQNTAPVLSTTINPLLNNLLAWQTASEGYTLEQLLFVDGTCIISDAEDIAASALAPKGIAITGQTATNGTWQYKIGTGSWTAFGAVSNTNALLLSSSTPVANVTGQEVRIRFVPTGPGTPSFSFRAWDLSTGMLGGYANASVNGGTTAFSTASKAISINVDQPATAPKFNLYVGSSTTDNILAVKTDRSTLVTYEGDVKLAANTNFQNGVDLDLDKVNNRLVWAESSATADKIVSCDTNGANVTVLYTFPASSSIPIGVAASPTNLFFTDNAAASRGLYRSNLDGSNTVRITGGTSQLATPTLIRDVEFYNNKVYVISRPASADYKIMELDSTGLNPVEIASTPNLPLYLAVAGGNVYWTENVSGGQIYTKPISGGTQTQLLSNSVRNLRDLVVDGTNNRIYYLDGSTASTNPDRYLSSLPITGGTPTRLLSLPANYLTITSDNFAAATSLPVTLISFQGSAAGTANRLDWQLNTDKSLTVAIERSPDGLSFERIGTVLHAAGLRFNGFTDINPSGARNYYRLRYGAGDGQMQYSQTVAILGKGPSVAPAIHPNPAADFIVIDESYATGFILNMQNQVVARLNGERRFSLEAVPAGIFTVQLIHENGSVSAHRLIRK